MTDAPSEPTPFVARHGGLRTRAMLAAAKAFVRVTLLVSPRPAVVLLHRAFAAGGAETTRKLARHIPAGVDALLDERYGDGADAVLDVFRPAAASGALPTVVWIHGGGWIGGAKEEVRGYAQILASHGYAVVAPRYALAPGARYPVPLRQLMQALAHLEANAERLGLDPSRIVVAGDSAGAQLAAQLAAIVTTPGYAEAVGVAPAVAPERLRGVVLACGPYDLALLEDAARSGTARRMVQAVLWAYAGRRRFRDDPAFATFSVSEHLSAAFPPALVTVGNADPLRPHSEQLAARLRALGVPVETCFFAPDHRPPLHHEYQFDLDSEAGRAFLDQLLTFLAGRLSPDAG